MKLKFDFVVIALVCLLSTLIPIHLFASTNIIENSKVMEEIIELGFIFFLVIAAFMSYNHYRHWKENQNDHHH